MARVLYDVNISLDGFIAGSGQDQKDGARRLDAWKQELAVFRKKFPYMGLEGGVTNASTAVLEEEDTTGALIIGRNFFGGGVGPWKHPPSEGSWKGTNPFGVPVFVLTHHPREPFAPGGGPPFTFVTTGIKAARQMAEEAAPGKDLMLGGAQTARQFLAAGQLDQLDIHLVPTFLGRGLRLFHDEALRGVTLEQTRVIEAPGVTHIRYRLIPTGSK